MSCYRALFGCWLMRKLEVYVRRTHEGCREAYSSAAARGAGRRPLGAGEEAQSHVVGAAVHGVQAYRSLDSLRHRELSRSPGLRAAHPGVEPRWRGGSGMSTLRQLCIRARVTQKDLSARMGVSQEAQDQSAFPPGHAPSSGLPQATGTTCPDRVPSAHVHDRELSWPG